MTDLDPFAHDDGVYVIGALAAEERAAFERHLSTCPACADRVRDVAALSPLLATVPASAYDDATDPAPTQLLPELLRRVQADRRRRHWVSTALAGLAAACLVALAVVLWPTDHPASPGSGTSRPQAMSAVSAASHPPLHATAALTEVSWGTQITLACRYNAPETPGVAYQLVVFDKQDVAHPSGSWTLIPEKLTHFTGGTALRRDQISRVAITIGNRVILQLRL